MTKQEFWRNRNHFKFRIQRAFSSFCFDNIILTKEEMQDMSDIACKLAFMLERWEMRNAEIQEKKPWEVQ